jgi:hypothetical protein
MTQKGAARVIDPEKIKAKLERDENPNVGKRGYNKQGEPNATPKTKGRVTKPTRIARETLALALEGCTDEIKSALKEVRYKDPKSYIECVVKLLPYVTPKLLAAQISEERQTKIEINLTKDTSLDTLKNLLGEEIDSVEDVEFENL